MSHRFEEGSEALESYWRNRILELRGSSEEAIAREIDFLQSALEAAEADPPAMSVAVQRLRSVIARMRRLRGQLGKADRQEPWRLEP